MNTTLRSLILTILSFLSISQLHAQSTTFIPDVNYAYLDRLIATAKKNYPEIKVRQSQANFARYNWNASKISWLDIFTASYIYQPKNSQNLLQPTIFNGYQLSISVNLGQIFSKPATIHAARETYNVTKYQQAEYLLSLEAQVKRYYFAYLAGQAEVRLRSSGTIDAEAAVKQLKYSFQKNETTFEIYNQALTNLYNQNGFQVQAELAMLTAKANLEELLGMKLEDVK